MSTYIVSAILVGIITAIIRKMYKDKKNGKSICGSSCQDCPRSEICHPKDNPSQYK